MKITFKSILPSFNKIFADKQAILDKEFTEAEISKAFGVTLKKLREFKGLSLTALSKEVDIPNPTINRYENGVNIPTITQAIKITDYFDLSIELFVLMGLCALYEGTDITVHYQRLQNALQEAQRQAVIDRARKKR